MSDKTKLTVDQRLQVARMATDVFLQIFPRAGIETTTGIAYALSLPGDIRDETLTQVQKRYDWAFDLIASKVLSEPDNN